ncbi:MAG TPA: hypothetical protein PLF81_16120, partial [Candidatus Anammoximicrobium sp.]|nr:hypothetical protein [Candidatus Anammoximicrobium sp.]
MKRLWKRSVSVLAVLALALTTFGASVTGSAFGQEPKPLVVASLAGSDEVLSNILYVTEAASVGDFGRLAAMLAGPYTAPLDKTRPFGVYLTLLGEDDVRAMSFVPVKDLKMLLMTMEQQIGKPEDLGGGVLKIAADRPQPMFVKESDGWAFVANRQEHLNDLPKDPVAILDGLDKKYTFALRVNVCNIPSNLREMAVTQVRQGFEDRVAQELNPQQAQAMRQFGGLLVDSIVQVIEETDHITLGWQVDQEAKKTYLDVNFTAVQGTELAKQMKLIKEGKSAFAGFSLPDAAMTFLGHGASSKSEVEQSTALLARFREQAMRGIENDGNLANDDERQTVKAIANQLLDIADETVKAAKMDAGAALVLKEGSLAFAGGGFVADGVKLAETLKKLAEFAAQKDPNFPGVNFDAETYEGVTFHTARIPLQGADSKAREILGDPLELVIGTAKTSAYVAFGKDAAGLLKSVLAASSADRGKQLPPSQLRLALTPILAFVAATDPKPEIQAALNAVKQYAGSDTISVTTTPIENGCTVRLEVHEGVLK